MQRQRSVSVWVARANVAAVMAVAVLVLLLVAPRYAAGAERSITLARADALALAVLRPSAQAGQVVLFRSRQPLVAADAVTEAGPRVRHGRSALFPHGIGHRAWMFWEDLAFNSPFVHPSRVLLIDAVSGAVLKLVPLNYFPLVDGHAPAYLDGKGRFEHKYQLYVSPRLRDPAPAETDQVTALAETASTGPAASAASVAVLPPGAFAGDCAIMVGKYTPDDQDGTQFSATFDAMARFLTGAGIPTYWSTQEGPPTKDKPGTAQTVTGEPLARNVDYLVSHERCKDVFIYLAGHGNPKINHETGDEWPGPYHVTTGPAYSGYVTAEDIARIVAAHPKTTFKLKVDSCYSGRMLDPQYGLKRLNNLLVVETSNNDNEYGSFAMEYADGKPISRLVPNPDKVMEFTNGDLYGMRLFLESQDEVDLAHAAGGSFFAHMLAWSFTLGQTADQARYTLGGGNKGDVAHPQLSTNYHPSIVSVTPYFGPSGGGTQVTIDGVNFLPGATVTVGGKPATDVTVVDAGTITATTPPGTAGTRVDVTVINPGGHSGTASGAFIYVPSRLAFATEPSNSVAGATIAPAVTIRITDDSGNTVTAANGPVTISLAANADGATLSGTTTITAVNGVATFANLWVDQPGTYTLQASSPGLASAGSNSFTISSAASIGLSPDSAPPGTFVTIRGSGFLPGSDVSVFFAGGSAPVTTVATDPTGSFVATFPVPSDTTTGAQTVLATDGIGHNATATFTVTPGYQCVGGEIELFNNWNGDAVQNGGTEPSFSTQGNAYCLDSISTYHWNNANGQTPGTIGLTGMSGAGLGPWAATGRPGQATQQYPDGVPNADWTVTPGSPSQPVIINGAYSCDDSDPSTWSQNSTSDGQGFCEVWVQTAQQTTQ